ncbi:MAG: hypothetical protein CVU84_00200 [Firmicutes bacterium HGW-Firmicutes-1]|nr:MAG: hypothetical protein CVU84_00200 [Firmicutes bacterium HGW-Firmicutes-1]
MKKLIQRTWRNEKGFTLIELIIVIAILAIIAAVAIPNILKAVDNSRRTTDVTEAKMIADAANQILAKNEASNGVTYLRGAALNVTGLTVAGAGADAQLAFSTNLFTEFRNGMPAPGFQGTSITETNYYLVILADGTIEVWVGSAADMDTGYNADGSATTGRRLYPTPHTDYENK